MFGRTQVINQVKPAYRAAVQRFVASDDFGKLVKLSQDLPESNYLVPFETRALVDSFFLVAGGSNEPQAVDYVVMAARILDDLKRADQPQAEIFAQVREAYNAQIGGNQELQEVLGGGTATERVTVKPERKRQ